MKYDELYSIGHLHCQQEHMRRRSYRAVISSEGTVMKISESIVAVNSTSKLIECALV